MKNKRTFLIEKNETKIYGKLIYDNDKGWIIVFENYFEDVYINREFVDLGFVSVFEAEKSFMDFYELMK